MTLMAAEYGATAVESETRDAMAAVGTATRPARTGGRTQQGAQNRPPARTGGRTQQGTSGARRVATTVAKATPQGKAATTAAKVAPKPTPQQRHAARVRAGNQRQPLPYGVARNRRVAKQAASTGAKKLTGNYHGAVFGEWLAAVLLIAALPFARPNKTGVSPYSGKDMVQLLAITVVYLILAILAVPGKTSARFAAWFGALLLLAIGLAETANIASAVSAWLNPASTATATTAAPKANPSTVNPGSTAPAAATATGISRNVAQNPGNGLS